MPSMGSEFAFGPAVVTWVAVLFSFAFAILTVTVAGSFVVGGKTGPLAVLRVLQLTVSDWFSTSPRRIWAVSWLTFLEAIRRKALLVGVIFAILFLFGGWFLAQPASDAEQQVKVYVAFVMRVIMYLTLPMLLLLSCWSIPEDIRVRSIHTVVTKPVRRQEIVIGRVVGFSMIGGMLLLIMGVVGYVWILRQLSPQGRERLVSRQPVYGKISFKDREGVNQKQGINTGDEWMFRSFIEGGTKSRMVWTFEGLTDPKLLAADHLPLEAGFQVFRSYKGNLDRGISCQIQVQNPVNEKRAVATLVTERDAQGQIAATDSAFEVKEFKENLLQIARRVVDDEGNELDLFRDFVADGQLKVEVACLPTQQYIGAAGPDLFVRLPDKPFIVGYSKGLLGIGLLMLMVIVMGVCASTFVKGPIATMLVFFIAVVGMSGRAFLDTIVDQKWVGGGAFESIYRVLAHLNPTTELPKSLPFQVMQFVDGLGVGFLKSVRYIFPDFKFFDLTPYVAYGFDVPWTNPIPPNDGALLPSIVITLGYMVPWILVAYYSLRLRELEAK
jgi:hypothetical protein